MFSLVITIISVALVASLALATLYYGGTAFNRGQADAQAAKVRIQGQQLLAATDLFKVHHGRIPNSVEELVSADYLQSAPIAKAALQSALAASPWFMPLPGEAVFLLDIDFPDACRSINESSYGKRAILNGVLGNIQVQCYGPNTTELYTMVAKDPKAIDALVTAEETDVTGPAPIPTLILQIPADNNSTDWSSPPEGTSGGETGGEPGVGALAPSESSLSLGPTTVGTSVTQAFSFQNSGNAALTLSALNFSAPQFSATTNGCTGILAAGASCSITVRYAPSDVGNHAGTMTLVGDDASSAVSLSGQATAALVGVLDLTSTPAGFPGVQVGQTGTQTVTVGNTGTAAFSFTTTPFVFAGDGKFTLNSTCGATVEPGQSCTLTVTFAPTDTTPAVGYLNFDTNVSEPTSLSLTGTGVAAPAGVLSVGSAPAAFAAQVGYISEAQTVTLQNTGNAALTFTAAPAVTGSSTFAATSTCGASLAAGASCAVSVTFSPTNTTTQTGALTFDTDVSSPSSIALSGTGSTTPPLPSGAITRTLTSQLKAFYQPTTVLKNWSDAHATCENYAYGSLTNWSLGGVTADLEALRLSGQSTFSGEFWSSSTTTSGTNGATHWYINFTSPGSSKPSGAASAYQQKDSPDSALKGVLCVHNL